MNRGTVLFFLILMVNTSICFAGFEQKDQGARSAGLADAVVARGFSSWCLFSNPAGLATLSAPELNVSVFRPFGLKELQTASTVIGFKIDESAIGFGAVNSGFSPYTENQFSAGFAYPLTENLNGGLTLNLLQVSIEEYGSASALTVDGGLLFYPFEGIQAGFSVFNLGKASIGKSADVLPSGWRSGLSAWIENRLQVSYEWYQQSGYEPDFRFGLEFPVHEYVTLRTGLSSEPYQISLGTGFSFFNVNLDYAWKNHPDLGMTHQVTVGYSFSSDPAQHYPSESVSWTSTGNPGPAGKKRLQKQQEIKPVNLNEATVADLASLPGMTTELAELILELREKRGRFVSLDELMLVKGMTETRLSKLRQFLFILESLPETP